MASKTLERPSRVLIDVNTKSATTSNPKAIREAAKEFAQVKAGKTTRGDLLRRLSLTR